MSAEFAYGLAAGVVIAVGVYLAFVWRARRSRAGDTLPPSIRSPASTVPIPPDLPAPAPAPTPSETRPGPVETDPSPEPADAFPRSGAAERPGRRRLPPSETLRLSQRVILHVYAQGNLAAGEVAPPGLCQAGMVEALGIPQAGLAAVLRRLEAAGVFVTERGHVRGRDRRLKIYRLSDRGVGIARELRSRSPPRPTRSGVPPAPNGSPKDRTARGASR